MTKLCGIVYIQTQMNAYINGDIPICSLDCVNVSFLVLMLHCGSVGFGIGRVAEGRLHEISLCISLQTSMHL